MSYCAHDPYCPGYGDAHDAGLPTPDEHGRLPGSVFYSPPKLTPARGASRDRTLPGKRRRKARQGRL